MPEVTDSYCERCGARHVFSSSGSRRLSLRGPRVLAKGLKNFVLNDGQSIADSITTARLEDESGDSSRMTEAFHKAFHFCMTCRQYACDNCWNADVGACFSCAPSVDSAPVAREGHLIVRTPVARWDPDLLNFSDSAVDSAAGTGTPSLPAGWPASLQIGPIIPQQARKDHRAPSVDQSTAPAQPAAWPATDLPKPRAADASPSAKIGRGGRKVTYPGSWKQWPMADELAPEMTLTPEEMLLVEAGLNHPESSHPSTASAPSAADAAVPAAGPGLEPIPSRSTLPAWETVAPSQPLGPISAPLSPPAPPAPEPTVTAAADSTTSAAASAEATPAPLATPTVATPVTPESRPASPRLVTPTPVLPVQPAPSVATPQEPVERVGLVARLLSRHDAKGKQGTPDIPESTPENSVATEPWPRPTPWAKAPLRGHRWRGDSANDPSRVDRRADVPVEPAVEDAADLALGLLANSAVEPAVEPAVEDATDLALGLLADVPAEPAAEPAAELVELAELAAEPAAELAELAVEPAVENATDLALDLLADVPAERVPDQTAPVPLPEGIDEPKLVLMPVVALEPATDIPSVPAAAVQEPADFDAALAGELRDAAALSEARSAAAIDQSADAHAPNRPADEGAAAARPVEQSEAPAQPDADADVAEEALPRTASHPAPLGQAADAAPVEPSTPPVLWPPLAASWPAPNAHRGTWPGLAAPLPAAVTARQAPPQFAVEMWAQSSQEVMNRGTVRVCHSCALPVSTQARFCRRCGTQQA